MRIKTRFTIKNAEMATAVLLSAIIVFLLVFRTIHAGALWRDECVSVQLALMPSFSEIYKNIQHDSFPLLFPALLRSYTKAFGTSNAAFRIFGLVVGIILIGMLWYNARVAGSSPPLLSPVLVGLNSNFLLSATSMRGYGLGCVLILLLFGLFHRTIDKPVPWRLVAVFLVSLASVHCLLFNSVLLCAMTGAAVIVLVGQRKYRTASLVALIAALSALSMALYYHSYASRLEWNMLFQMSLTLQQIGAGMNNALGAPAFFTGIFWYALLIAATVGTIMRLLRMYKAGTKSNSTTAVWFYLLTVLLSLAGYAIFLKLLGYFGRPWYFLALFSIVAVAVDTLAAKLAVNTGLRIARLALVFLAMIIMPAAAWSRILERQTNMDRIIRVLDLNVKNGDLIIINPWYKGITFNWYYRGTAQWVTLPIINDHRTHRCDLLKEKMMCERPLDDLYALVEKTLRESHRVWLGGDTRPPSDTAVPPSLPPAPLSRFGWQNGVYADTWALQFCQFLDRHSVKTLNFNLPVKNGVIGFEDASLLIAEGWK
jgi:hypothetical protein